MYKILFLCTGNSCRSQMAEGWARHLKQGQIEAYSAGTQPSQVNPYAVQVMEEVGVDITDQHSKHVTDLGGVGFDFVITVCDNAQQACPELPGEHRFVHHVFDDPPHLAQRASSDHERLEVYRRVRDEIRAFVETLPESL